MPFSLRIALLIIACGGWAGTTFAQISGKVYRDLNANGLQDSPVIAETGVSNVKIEAFNRLNQRIASTTTDAGGNYQLAVPQGKQVRVEISNLPTHYALAPANRSNATAIKFLTSPQSNANLGVYDPTFYTPTLQLAAVPMYHVGSHQNTISDSLDGILGFNLNTSEKIRLATDKEVGAVWALAYHPTQNQLFSAAIAKRHVGYGSLGTGGIYVTDLVTHTTKPFVNLADLGINTGENTHTDLVGTLENRSLDAKIFDQIGKVSLGGMDISDDGKTLFVMNLFDKTLYSLKLSEDKSKPTQQDVSSYPIPNLNYQGGEQRPFAVKYYHGKVYVGLVADAQLSQKAEDLKASVLALDVATRHFQEILQMPLNYAKGNIAQGVERSGWYAWTDAFEKTIIPQFPSTAAYPQPILADIEFDTDGSIILGFMDRFGNQSGTAQPSPTGDSDYTGIAAGDILRVFYQESNKNNVEAGQTHENYLNKDFIYSVS